MTMTLTVAEIVDLAQFAGLVLNSNFTPTDEDLETEIELRECPAQGAWDEEEQRGIKTRFVAVMAECPEEGCMPLGPELKA